MVTDERQRRAFLRIPVSIPAAIYIDGRLYKKLKLSDLSTNGLSLFSKSSDTLPDHFEIRFKLSPFSKVIKIIVAVRNRIIAPEGVRTGCFFTTISDEDKKRVDKYVSSFLEISFPEQTVNLAAFLWAMDACFRVLFFAVNFYYSATDLGWSSPVPPVSPSFGTPLAFYVSLAFLAFILSSPSIVGKRKINFVSALFLSGYAFFFLITKSLICWKEGLWNTHLPFLNMFLMFQLFLVFYLGFAIVIGVFFLNKISWTLDIVKQEFATMKLRFGQLKFLKRKRS